METEIEQNIETGLEAPAQQLEAWLVDATQITWLADVLTGLVIVVVTAIISHALTKLIRGILSHEVSPIASTTIFVNVGRVVVWSIGACILLSVCFDVNVNALLAALGVGGIALSLGLQDTISNIIGGLQVSVLGILEPGDHVIVSGIEGVVRDITWRQTDIEGFTGECTAIPNSVINKNSLVVLPPVRKVKIPLSVSYTSRVVESGCSLGGVEQRIVASCRAALTDPAPAGFGLKLSKEPTVFFTEVGDYSYSGSLVTWIEEGETFDLLAVKSALVKAVADVLDEARPEDEAQPGE